MSIRCISYLSLILGLLMFSSCGDEVNGLTADEYAEKHNLSTEELDDGVLIHYLYKGAGTYPIVDDVVKVAYKGYLTDGSVFDQNDEAEFLLRNVIRGWQIGMKAMPVGTKAILIIPSDQGYGKRGTGSIPANSTLVFEVELFEIVS